MDHSHDPTLWICNTFHLHHVRWNHFLCLVPKTNFNSSKFLDKFTFFFAGDFLTYLNVEGAHLWCHVPLGIARHTINHRAVLGEFRPRHWTARHGEWLAGVSIGSIGHRKVDHRVGGYDIGIGATCKDCYHCERTIIQTELIAKMFLILDSSC